MSIHRIWEATLEPRTVEPETGKKKHFIFRLQVIPQNSRPRENITPKNSDKNDPLNGRKQTKKHIWGKNP